MSEFQPSVEHQPALDPGGLAAREFIRASAKYPAAVPLQAVEIASRAFGDDTPTVRRMVFAFYENPSHIQTVIDAANRAHTSREGDAAVPVSEGSARYIFNRVFTLADALCGNMSPEEVEHERTVLLACAEDPERAQAAENDLYSRLNELALQKRSKPRQ